MPNLTREKIDTIKKDLQECVDEITFEDEILQRLYLRIYEQICTDLTTLWFYYSALKDRGDKLK